MQCRCADGLALCTGSEHYKAVARSKKQCDLMTDDAGTSRRKDFGFFAWKCIDIYFANNGIIFEYFCLLVAEKWMILLFTIIRYWS